AIAAIIGIAIVIVGGTRNHQSIIYAHTAAAFVATFILGAQQTARRTVLPVMAAIMVLPLVHSSENRQSLIANPAVPPSSMDAEGGGKNGPFFPSSIETTSGGHLSTEFISDSKMCA